MARRKGKQATRYFRVAVAILCCLCANSVSTFSLYGPAFITNLGYTQARLNVVSVIAELAIYLPVPLWGYLCDRKQPGFLAALSALLYGYGYILAAFTYRSGPPADSSVTGINTSANGGEGSGNGWPFSIMIMAFIGIGGATMCLYLGAISVCVRAFDSAKYRGIVLALPITSFGLSSLWQAQVGVHYLYKKVDGEGRRDGEVQLDVFKYFIFLGCLLIAVSVLGALTFGLTSLEEEDEKKRGDEDALNCVDGNGDEDVFLRTADIQQHDGYDADGRNYNSINGNEDRHSHSQTTSEEGLSDGTTAYSSEDPRQPLLTPKRTAEPEQEEPLQLRSSSTFDFLSDRTMHLVAIGFIFLIGPCETYINNVGTIIPALNAVADNRTRSGLELMASLPESHVSIVALGSTFSRLFTGILSDLSIASAGFEALLSPPILRFSRMLILLPCMGLLFLGFLLLALPQAVSLHPSLLLITSALVGVGYGAGFTVLPVIVSVVWGLDSFATNWGIVAMLPVGGVGFWSWVYATIYSEHTRNENLSEGQCVGYACYGYWAAGCATSIAMTLATWSTAWRLWAKRQTKV